MVVLVVGFSLLLYGLVQMPFSDNKVCVVVSELLIIVAFLVCILPSRIVEK
jgi:hypothetical protein